MLLLYIPACLTFLISQFSKYFFFLFLIISNFQIYQAFSQPIHCLNCILHLVMNCWAPLDLTGTSGEYKEKKTAYCSFSESPAIHYSQAEEFNCLSLPAMSYRFFIFFFFAVYLIALKQILVYAFKLSLHNMACWLLKQVEYSILQYELLLYQFT